MRLPLHPNTGRLLYSACHVTRIQIEVSHSRDTPRNETAEEAEKKVRRHGNNSQAFGK